MPDPDAEIVLYTDDDGEKIDVLVDSTDQAVAQFAATAGKILMPLFDIQIGRCAAAQAPWGNQLVLLDMSKGLLNTNEEGKVIEKSEYIEINQTALPNDQIKPWLSRWNEAFDNALHYSDYDKDLSW